MSDITVMQQQFPATNREMSISCGVCDPMNIINRLTYRRYDAGVIAVTATAGVSLVVTAQTINLFTTGVGEQINGLAATALKDRSWTNLDPGGAPIDSPCVFTAYGISFELLDLAEFDTLGNELQQPALYYDQAYKTQLLHEAATVMEVRIEEPNGCRDFLPPVDMLPSDGSSRAVGDRNRSAMLGVLTGLRIAVCFPGQNSKRPFIPVQVEKTVTLNQNGANPIPATTSGSTLGIKTRVVIVGSAETPA